jgi:tripartite-type tricarboxylate transporter receptor subunit TctC
MLNAPEVPAHSQEGTDPVGSTPDQFAARVKSEIAKWANVIRETGIGTIDRVARTDRSESGCVA